MSKSIKILECYGEFNKTTTSHRTDDTDQAIERAIAKRYGSKAIFMESERNGKYRLGQVFKLIKGTSTMTSLTSRIHIKVD